MNWNIEARSFDINENSNEIYIGAQDGHVHVKNLNLEFISKHKFHMSEISVVKVSNNGQLVASGDTTKNIYIWNASSKEVVNNRFVFHSAKVFDIAWSQDDLMLASGSLDHTVIIWSIAEKSRIKVLTDVDIEAILSVRFVNSDKEFIFGGHSCGLRKYAIA